MIFEILKCFDVIALAVTWTPESLQNYQEYVITMVMVLSLNLLSKRHRLKFHESRLRHTNAVINMFLKHKTTKTESDKTNFWIIFEFQICFFFFVLKKFHCLGWRWMSSIESVFSRVSAKKCLWRYHFRGYQSIKRNLNFFSEIQIYSSRYKNFVFIIQFRIFNFYFFNIA